MQQEPNIKEIPITIETAHQFFNKRQMAFIVKLYKNVYKEGFKNGAKLALLLCFNISIAQSNIIASADQNQSIGEVFPIMQQDAKNYVPLNVPKYEIEKPKPIVKKKLTFWQRILKLFGL